MSSEFSTLLLSLLTEARRQDLPYTEKQTKKVVEKVIVTVSGTESAKFTRLAKQYKELKDSIDALSGKMDELNAQIKEDAIDLFDATDEVYTRIVETAQMTILIGKRQPDSMEKVVKVNYEEIISKITELVPGLKQQIDEIIEANTEISEKLKVAKAPQLRVDLKEADIFASIIKFAKSVGRRLLSTVKSWTRVHDRKVKEIQELIQQLPK